MFIYTHTCSYIYKPNLCVHNAPCKRVFWRRSSNDKKILNERRLPFDRRTYTIIVITIDIFIILLYFLSILHSAVYVTYYYYKHSFAAENREILNVTASITICSFVPTRIRHFSLFFVRSSRLAVGGLSLFVNIIGTFFTFMGRIGSFSCSRRPLDSRPDSLNRLFYIYYYIFVLHTHTYTSWLHSIVAALKRNIHFRIDIHTAIARILCDWVPPDFRGYIIIILNILSVFERFRPTLLSILLGFWTLLLYILVNLWIKV